MEEKEYYTEEEMMKEVEKIKKATDDLEKLAKLQDKIDSLKK